MALSKSTVKATIKDRLQAAYNTPEYGEPALDTFADGMADAFLDILKDQMEVKTSGSIPAEGIIDSQAAPCSGSSTATDLEGVVS